MSHSSLEFDVKPGVTMSRPAIESMVLSTVAKRLKRPMEEIALDTRFEDLGVDSLDMAEMFFLLEDQLLKTIPLDQGVRLQTVGDVVTLVADQLVA